MRIKVEIIIILASLMIANVGQKISYAANEATAYFSYKLTNKGIIFGVEIFDNKTGKSVINDSKDYIYKWKLVSDREEKSKSSQSNSIFFLTDYRLTNFYLEVGIYRTIGSSQPVYVFNQEIIIPEPRVKIVKKFFNLTLPFNGQLNINELLSFKFYGFSSPPDRVMWLFNDAFISNLKEITKENLPENSGVIKIQVFSRLNEKASDFRSVKVDQR
ncbi:MAG: hypothetical protein KatS3mg093_099 [Candidatus Parcubacteria bacterium]|nr:MAG: hypothetical protein KatS3mg093_099 [Candidatus Parcubacteria bacterium]